MSTPIPQPPGIPFLGNIFDVDPSNPWWSFKTLAEKYGEIFKIKVLGHEVVFIASAALVEEICDETRFRKFVGGPIVELRYTVHDSLFTAFDHEESWGVAHRIMAPRLSLDAIAGYFDEILLCTDELIKKWKSRGADKFQPLKDLNKLDLETTTLTLFGKKLDCINAAEEHPVIQAMEDLNSEAVKRPSRPKLLNWLLYDGKFKGASKTLRGYAADLVNYRNSHPNNRHDLLWALMNATDPETGKKLTDEQIVDEIINMPIGSSTAACGLTSLVLFLSQSPEVVTKAREEIDRVVGGRDGVLKHEHIPQLQYVQGVVQETLRLGNPAPGFNIEPIPKEDKSPVLLQGGKYQIAHNQAMVIVLSAVSRDPAVFETPLEFRPERMVGENFEKLPVGAKKWFGNGKRWCIGKHWAWEFLVVVTVRLIQEIDFEVVDKDYVVKQDGWLNLRPINFYVKAKARA